MSNRAHAIENEPIYSNISFSINISFVDQENVQVKEHINIAALEKNHKQYKRVRAKVQKDGK